MTGSFSRFPAFRLILPFILGIIAHSCWHSWWAACALLLVAVVIYPVTSVNSKSPARRLKWRPFFMVSLALASMALGWLTALIHCPPRLSPDSLSVQVLSGRVEELDFTDFSTRMTVDLIGHDMPSAKVLVTTRGCDYTLRAGDLVRWESQMNEVGNMGNPYEMDYAAHLIHDKGIRYQQHLPISKLHKVGHSPTIMTRMAETRRSLKLMISNSGLSPSAQHLIIALLLGDSSMIDKATRQEFSTAGIAHVLALSGLHVGIIALMIWWLFFPLDYLRKRKWRLVITLIVIASFALFTGQSPSVLRAAIMIGFAFTTLVFYRRSVPFNSLCMAALLILVFSPSSLYSVGFQLSFITLGAILLFNDIPATVKTGNSIVNRVRSTVLTSLIAMVATLSLTAHYFHTVSFTSVISNLLVLPVLPFLMVLGALFLLVTLAGWQWHLLEKAIDIITSYIHWIVSSVNSIPLTHLNHVYVSTFGTVVYFVLIALIGLWLYKRNPRFLLAAGIALIVLLSHSIWVETRIPRQGTVLLNSFTSTPVLYYDHGHGYVWTPDDYETDLSAFSRFYSGFIAAHGISELTLIDNDSTVHLKNAFFKPPHAYVMNHRLLLTSNSKWHADTASERMKVDDLVVTKRFRGTVSQLLERYAFGKLIFSGAMHQTALLPLLHECDSLGITPHVLSEDGAYEIP